MALDPETLHRYSVKAADYLEEAGIRYMAATFRGDDNERLYATTGWAVAILSAAERVKEYMAMLRASPQDVQRYMERISQDPHLIDLTKRFEEAKALHRLGEGS